MLFPSLLAHRVRPPIGDPCHYVDYEGRPLCGLDSDHRPGEEHTEDECAARGHVRCVTCVSLLDLAERMEVIAIGRVA